MGDEDLARQIMEVFVADFPQQIEALRRCVSASDGAGARRQAHLLKGAAAAVGGEALREAALQMETACGTGDASAVAAGIDDLEHQFLRLKKAMSNLGTN
jgi:HPt (histidine-containing phosphotransfer) domain-containing protein